MAYAFPGEAPVDYAPCRYGDSRLLFRGPFRAPARDYCVALGGTETFGRDVAEPWPTLLEHSLGRMVINLGLPNAGADVYLRDPSAACIAANATTAFLQLPGAINLSNRFYSVHPRRNDRVLRIMPELRTLYPGLDFIEFNFTNHLVLRLREVDPQRFATLREELRRCWIARMGELLARLPARTMLVWLAETPVPDQGILGGALTPALVDQAMISAISGDRPLVEIIVGPTDPRRPGQADGQERLHRRIAHALAPHAAQIAEKQTGARRRP